MAKPLQSSIEKKALKQAEAILPKAWELASSIHRNPEPAYKEHLACDLITGFLAEFGFKVETGIAGLPTAFKARSSGGRARPALAFLAEMDALPGMGHACGHNLIAASSAGAAAVLAGALDDPSGSVRVIGCPAEEGEGGKILLANAGVFDRLDCCLIVHPDKRTEVEKPSLGLVKIELKFQGRAAHASAYPEEGVNALDAVIQTFNAVALMRQQMSRHARVHGIITEGGQAPNIIPDSAGAVFLARALTMDETLEMAQRVVDCAKGAAGATGARVSIEVDKENMYAPYVPNRAMAEVFIEALRSLGMEAGKGVVLEGLGSTDVGNVCMQVPVLHPMIALPGVSHGVHTPEFAEAAGGEAGRSMLDTSIKALAITGARILLDEQLRKRIKNEHRENI